jgi:hypothetical protein
MRVRCSKVRRVAGVSIYINLVRNIMVVLLMIRLMVMVDTISYQVRSMKVIGVVEWNMELAYSNLQIKMHIRVNLLEMIFMGKGNIYTTMGTYSKDTSKLANVKEVEFLSVLTVDYKKGSGSMINFRYEIVL